MHHIVEVSEGGSDDPANLIALCPTCHALYHRGTISRDALYAYKAMLISLGRAFDVSAIDRLLFLDIDVFKSHNLALSGDGLLHFDRLIAGGLVGVGIRPDRSYFVFISDKGRLLLDAWKRGDRNALNSALAP